jgi:hypothetical protein
MLESHADTPSLTDVFGVGLRQDPIERAAQLGRLTGLCAAFLRSSHPAIALLRRAETGDDAALEQALGLIADLPTLVRRRIVASFGALQWLPRQIGGAP